MKIDARLFPLALHGALGNAFHPGNLGKGEAAEKAQVDELGESGVAFGELIERFADTREFLVVGNVICIRTERGDLKLATAFLRPAIPRVVDDQAAHDARRIAHESRLVGEADAVVARHINVGLMEECGRADRDWQTDVSQFAFGQTMQLGIERGEERFRGGPVAAISCGNQRCDG